MTDTGYFFGGWSSRMGVAILGIFLGFLVAACTPPAKPVSLLSAEAAVEEAQSDPQVRRYAPIKLEKAQKTLQRAQTAWQKGEGGQTVAHLAYLAKQRAAIAEVVAKRKKLQARIEALNKEREQILREANEARIAQLKQKLLELKAKKTERGYVIALGNILFEVDKAKLSPGAKQNLLRLVEFLKEFPKREVVVEGHTDSTGSKAYNLKLSQRRADAVRDFLVKHGIAPDRIVARGYGEAYPVAPNDTAAGRQHNRRVEIVILDAGEQAEAYQRSS